MTTKTIKKLPILSTTIGISKEITVLNYGKKGAFPKIYLQAGIHSDELPGILALNHLQELLDNADKQGKIIGEIVLVPFANPVGMGQFINGYHLGRFDFDMTGNFNRDYLDLATLAIDNIVDKLTNNIDENTTIIRQQFAETIQKYSPSLEIEDLKKKLLLLSFDSDFVIDLHCDTNSIIHMYANKNHITEAENLANHMNNSIMLVEDNPGGMSFDEANASPWWRLRELLLQQGINKPIANACFASTVELRGQTDVSDELNSIDAKNIYNYLVSIDAINEEKPTIAIQQNILKQLDAVDTIKSPTAGILVFKKQLGDKVITGDVIAEIIDYNKSPSENNRIQLKSNTNGILFAKINNHQIRPGHIVAKIAGDKTLDYRTGNLLGF